MHRLALPPRTREAIRDYALGLALVPFAVYFFVVDFSEGGVLVLLVHSFDLLIHEAGHFFFRFFGETLMIAGGSILQIALPALFVWQGLYWNHRAGTQLALLLLGQNFIDVAVYVADAPTRSLPLIGGLSPEAHDWGQLLGRAGWLGAADEIAAGLYGLAVVAWIGMVLVPRWVG